MRFVVIVFCFLNICFLRISYLTPILHHFQSSLPIPTPSVFPPTPSVSPPTPSVPPPAPSYTHSLLCSFYYLNLLIYLITVLSEMVSHM